MSSVKPLAPVRLTEIEKAQLLDILGQARFEKSVEELHYKLRCHWFAEEIMYANFRKAIDGDNGYIAQLVRGFLPK